MLHFCMITKSVEKRKQNIESDSVLVIISEKKIETKKFLLIKLAWETASCVRSASVYF